MLRSFIAWLIRKLLERYVSAPVAKRIVDAALEGLAELKAKDDKGGVPSDSGKFKLEVRPMTPEEERRWMARQDPHN